MKQLRTVRKIVTGKDAVDGAGVKLVRVIGYRDTAEFDPFLMLDAFDSTNPDDYTKGFPWHPHRGIETITYLISGDIEHGDSLGNSGSILDGDCQWMTAGSGIIHQEMPKASERLFGVQLWLNLPARDKMVDPQYGDIKSEDITVVDEDGRDWSFESQRDSTLFIYILQGEGLFDPTGMESITSKRAVLFDEGDGFWVKAGDEGIRFLLLSGKPLKEPIAWGGPIVMNTRQELDQAFRELNENTFIKK